MDFDAPLAYSRQLVDVLGILTRKVGDLVFGAIRVH